MVRFLIRNAPADVVANVVDALRKQLGKPSIGSSCAKLTQEALKEGLQVRPDFADAVLKAIRGKQSEFIFPCTNCGDMYFFSLIFLDDCHTIV